MGEAVEVTVVSASELYFSEEGEGSFCVVSAGKQCHFRTPSTKDNNPKWSCKFIVPSSMGKDLRLTLWDGDQLDPSNLIGEVLVNLRTQRMDGSVIRFSLRGGTGMLGNSAELFLKFQNITGEEPVENENSPDRVDHLKKVTMASFQTYRLSKQRSRRSSGLGPQKGRNKPTPKLTVNLSYARLSRLPKFLTKVSDKWQTINFSFNKFTACPDVSNFELLSELNLGFNHIKNVSRELCSLVHLKKLNMCMNCVTELPDDIRNLTNLTELDLDNNDLASLPSAMGQLGSLKVLYLDCNPLTSLPPEIGQLAGLRTLSVNSAQLASLPATIANAVGLQSLCLAQNCLVELPSALGSLTALTRLNVENNRLGALPTSLGLCADLSMALVAGNPIEPPVLMKCFHHGKLIDALRLMHEGKSPEELLASDLSDSIGELEDITPRDSSGSSLRAAELEKEAEAFIQNKQFSKAEPLLESCIQIRKTLLAHNPGIAKELIKTMTNYGMTLQALGKHTKAKEVFEATNKILSTQFSKDDEVSSPSPNRKNSAPVPKVNLTPSEKQKMAELQSGNDQEAEAEALLHGQHYSKAEALLERIIMIRLAHMEDSEVRKALIRTLTNYSMTLQYLGKTTKSKEIIDFTNKVIGGNSTRPASEEAKDKKKVKSKAACGHVFQKEQLDPMQCLVCKRLVFGTRKNCFRCQLCKGGIHAKCLKGVTLPCTATLPKNTYSLETAKRKKATYGSDRPDPCYLFLLQACKNGHLDLLKKLFETHQGRAEHLRTKHIQNTSNTPIHVACFYGHEQVVKFFLDMDQDLVHTRNGLGMTPLHSAAMRGKLTCVQVLLEAHAEANARDYSGGWTALHHAAEQGHYTCVVALLDGGADPGILNAKGQKPLDRVNQRNHPQLYALLMQADKREEKGRLEEYQQALAELRPLQLSEDPLSWLRQDMEVLHSCYEMIHTEFRLLDGDGKGVIAYDDMATHILNKPSATPRRPQTPQQECTSRRKVTSPRPRSPTKPQRSPRTLTKPSKSSDTVSTAVAISPRISTSFPKTDLLRAEEEKTPRKSSSPSFSTFTSGVRSRFGRKDKTPGLNTPNTKRNSGLVVSTNPIIELKLPNRSKDDTDDESSLRHNISGNSLDDPTSENLPINVLCDRQEILSSLKTELGSMGGDEEEVDLLQFHWLMYRWTQTNQIDWIMSYHNASLVSSGVALASRCFAYADADGKGFLTPARLNAFLCDYYGFQTNDIMELPITLAPDALDLLNSESIDFAAFFYILSYCPPPEFIPIHVEFASSLEVAGGERTKQFKVLETTSLSGLKRALKDLVVSDAPHVELALMNERGTVTKLKRSRELETAIYRHKSRRGQKGLHFLKLKMDPIVRSSSTNISFGGQISSLGKMKRRSAPPLQAVNLSKPGGGMGLNLKLKKVEEQEPPFVAWLKSTTRDKYLWEVPYSDIKTGDCIGKGAYGAVYKAEFRGAEVAVKTLLHAIRQEEALIAFLKEIELMSKLQHENILGFIGACLEYPDMCYITSFMQRGSVNDVIKTPEGSDWGVKLKMSLDAAKGMQFLHRCKPPIVHRDLKSYNLLVDHDFRVVVGDFGVSEALEDDESRCAKKIGSINWMPPEVFDGEIYDMKSDVYSFGMVLWEMVTAQIPFGNAPTVLVLQLIDAGERPHIPASCDPDFAQLIRDCWEADPAKRPPFDTVVTRLEEICHAYDPATFPPPGTLAPAMPLLTSTDFAPSVSASPVITRVHSNTGGVGSTSALSTVLQSEGSGCASPKTGKERVLFSLPEGKESK